MEQLYTFHLFAGAGGGILADALLGHWPIGAIEIEPFARRVLHARQRDGLLPPFSVWDDVRTFRADNPECSEYIEGLRSIRDRLVVCGGFPCQDISAAGKGAGISGARSGLWGEMARIVREIRPRHVFVENSPILTSRGLHRVLGDVAEMGFDARWGVLGACCVGAAHRRERVWIRATRDTERAGAQGGSRCKISRERVVSPHRSFREPSPFAGVPDSSESGLLRSRHGVADFVGRIRAIGNGQVPAVAALAWQVLND